MRNDVLQSRGYMFSACYPFHSKPPSPDCYLCLSPHFPQVWRGHRLVGPLPRLCLSTQICVELPGLNSLFQACGNARCQVQPQEGQPQGHSRGRRSQSLRDHRRARGAHGTETAEQSAVSCASQRLGRGFSISGSPNV